MIKEKEKSSTRQHSREIHSRFDNNRHAVSFSTERGNQDITTNLQVELDQIHSNGYVILRNVLSAKEVSAIKSALQPHFIHRGRNEFEGTRTNRIYDLLSKSRVFDTLATHPRILRILDRLLLPNYLLTAYQAIHILPGETRQPLHYDDQFVDIPRPRNALSVGTIWAMTPFTRENGATLVIPKSHKWGEERPPNDVKLTPVEMDAGSVVVFLSTLWHAGGANVTTSEKRLGVSAQYCEPFMRPQENFMLSIPVDVALNKFSPKLRSLIGYSIHPPFVGHVNGEHPLKYLKRLVCANQQFRSHL
uniref:Phytanoyl-CoA dioxygenase n=1 Tax=Iridovirus LCIVAC01 TaxID=2506607 RepID=A0A481YRZ6_9VIRU|nr:MAG: phytanoyl-CoA dioxygenase [Iridovirus LCIVAC01]